MHQEVKAKNLSTLNQIRLITLLIEFAGFAFASLGLGIQLPWPTILGIFLFNLLLMMYSQDRYRQHRSMTSKELQRHLNADITLQAGLLFFTGGYTNPFISVFLVTTTIAASMLPQRKSWQVTLYAICCYSVLQWWYQPLTPQTSHQHMQPMVMLHLAGMWLTFTVSACLITGLVSRMANSLRAHRQEISESREHQLRHERILAVATTAAATAHELSTPLSTMSVLLQEIKLDNNSNQQLSDDIDLLRSQVDLCKQKIRSIVSSSQNLAPEKTSLSVFINNVIEEWQLLRPAATPKVMFLNQDDPSIHADKSLAMALINLLDNAEDASKQPITVQLISDSTVKIQIIDNGAGAPIDIVKRPGYTSISTKKNGSGLGLQLSVATIERFSGTVRLFPAKTSGTITEILLPKAG